MRDYVYKSSHSLDSFYTNNPLIIDIKEKNNSLYLFINKISISADVAENTHKDAMETDDTVVILKGFNITKLCKKRYINNMIDTRTEECILENTLRELEKSVIYGSSNIVEFHSYFDEGKKLRLLITSSSDYVIEVLIEYEESEVMWSQFVKFSWPMETTNRKKAFTIMIYTIIVLCAIGLAFLSIILISKYVVEVGGYAFEGFFMFYLGLFSLIERVINKYFLSSKSNK